MLILKIMNLNNEIVIIDYKLGNLFSIYEACLKVGLKPIISSDIKIIKKANAIILPGVGAFGDAMINLKRLDLISLIREFVESGKPIMGICLGMQILFEESEEFGVNKGLGILKGNITNFPSERDGIKIKIPQVGWNKIQKPKGSDWSLTPLMNINPGSFMYFVHSFYANPSNHEDILTLTSYYDITYASSVFRKNIFACQFHPEKSAAEGLKIYLNYKKQLSK